MSVFALCFPPAHPPAPYRILPSLRLPPGSSPSNIQASLPPRHPYCLHTQSVYPETIIGAIPILVPSTLPHRLPPTTLRSHTIHPDPLSLDPHRSVPTIAHVQRPHLHPISAFLLVAEHLAHTKGGTRLPRLASQRRHHGNSVIFALQATTAGTAVGCPARADHRTV